MLKKDTAFSPTFYCLKWKWPCCCFFFLSLSVGESTCSLKLKYNSPVSEFVTGRVFLVFKGVSQVVVVFSIT